MILLAMALAAGTASCPSTSAHVADKAQAHGRGLWIGGIAFDGASFTDISTSENRYTNERQLSITFSDAGGAKFHALQQGRVGQQLQIWLDNCLVSAPVLDEEIQGDQVEIHGSADTLDGIIRWWQAVRQKPVA